MARLIAFWCYMIVLVSFIRFGQNTTSIISPSPTSTPASSTNATVSITPSVNSTPTTATVSITPSVNSTPTTVAPQSGSSTTPGLSSISPSASVNGTTSSPSPTVSPTTSAPGTTATPTSATKGTEIWDKAIDLATPLGTFIIVVVAVALVLILLIALICVCCKYRSLKKRTHFPDHMAINDSEWIRSNDDLLMWERNLRASEVKTNNGIPNRPYNEKRT